MPPKRGASAAGFLMSPRVGDHAHADPVQVAGAADHLPGVSRLELVETVAVEDSLQDRVGVVRLAVVVRQEVVQLEGAPLRRRHVLAFAAGIRRAKGAPPPGGAAAPGSSRRPARGSGRRPLTSVCTRAPPSSSASTVCPVAPFTRFGPPSPMKRRALHHEDHVGEGGQVRTPGDAGAHDRGELGDAQVTAHHRVVVEEAGGAVLAGEDTSLVGQVHARGVHQIDDGDPAAHGDLLGAEHLLDGLRPPGPRLHRGVVGHHHDFPALDDAHAGHNPGSGSLALVEVVGHQEPHLHPRRPLVQEALHALPGRELALSCCRSMRSAPPPARRRPGRSSERARRRDRPDGRGGWSSRTRRPGLKPASRSGEPVASRRRWRPRWRCLARRAARSPWPPERRRPLRG